ncbi:unnamed protein product [Echinostoma caproni]|uniref:PH domain-containing protein n=1 Tax=Echinostoma caproni TaxID=27848 RepID=A0A183AA96_9TREM|nr:unnamed protein product [Echinostoma caproni]
MNKRVSGNTTFTVIFTNLPEPTSQSLRERQQDELNRWIEVCARIGVEAKPVSLTRLWRQPTSIHIGEPRLLRVTLASEEDVENVLLLVFSLKLGPAIPEFYRADLGLSVYTDGTILTAHAMQTTRGRFSYTECHSSPKLMNPTVEKK